MGLSQQAFANLLGMSLKAIQSYEQEWRPIADHVERQVLYLFAKHLGLKQKTANCWEIRKCDPGICAKCPARLYGNGHSCWFVTGTLCGGDDKGSWGEKMKVCRECVVFQPLRSAYSAPHRNPSTGCGRSYPPQKSEAPPRSPGTEPRRMAENP